MPAPQSARRTRSRCRPRPGADGAPPRALAGAEDQRRERRCWTGLVIGAGQCGLAVAHALRRDRVRQYPGHRPRAGGAGGALAHLCPHAQPALAKGPDRSRTSSSPPSPTRPGTRRSGVPRISRRCPGSRRSAGRTISVWFRQVTGIPVRNGVVAGAISPARTDDGLPCLADRDRAPARCWRGRW